MMAVYALTAIITGTWLIKSLSQKKLVIAKTPLDLPIVLFVGSQLVSTIFSTDGHVSWFGYYSRFNGGMWSVISYILLYYAFVTNFGYKYTKDKNGEITIQQFNNITIFTNVALASAFLVSVYGVLERLGIDKNLWVQDVQNRVFSTLGQPNWLAAYMVALIPLTAGLALKSQISNLKSQTNSNLNIVWNLEFVMWNFIAILFFIVLLFTRSRSGLLAFALTDIIFWGLIIFIRPDLKRLQRPALNTLVPCLLVHAAFALVIFFNGTNIAQIDKYFSFTGLNKRLSRSQPITNNIQPAASSGPALETGGTESGVIRKYVWQGALTAWNANWKNKLIGTGTETFAFTFFRYRPIGHNMTSEWDFLYNKAHNEYLNFLATTGVLGLGSYLLFIGSFIWWFIYVHGSRFTVQSHKNIHITMNNEQLIMNFALFSGWLSILITNFFGFSVVVTQVFLFLIPAMIFVLFQQFYPSAGGQAIQQYSVRLPFPFWTMGIAVACTAVVAANIGLLWYADTQYALSYRLARSGQYPKAYTLINRAILLNPGEPVYRDEAATTLASLAVDALSNKDATQGAILANNALAQSDRAIVQSPENILFWKTRTKIYYAFASFDPKFNDAALVALSRAYTLSPNDPRITYNLAVLAGRGGDTVKPVEYLKKTIAIKPDYRDAYYALYVFYSNEKKPNEARAILETYLTNINPHDSQFTELLDKSK
jgi:tetratricopeptide (TPR) repeat protein/O-antigen ligase